MSDMQTPLTTTPTVLTTTGPTTTGPTTTGPTTTGPTTTGPTAPNPDMSDRALSQEIDALSLRQALLDFELANARVLDLTARLVEANARVEKQQAELGGSEAKAQEKIGVVQAELDAVRKQLVDTDNARINADAAAKSARQELNDIKSSRSFRVARQMSKVVSMVRK
jgi:hypothetical protein